MQDSSATEGSGSRPLVSFVIPSYNYGRFLPRTIDRCLEQPVDGEVWVVDGGSTDETLDVLRSYGDRIQWVSERDHGQSDAVNKGIARARGNVIAWINSDDFYVSGKTLGPVAEAFADPEVDIVYGDGLLVDEVEEPRQTIRVPDAMSVQRLMLNPCAALFQPSVFFRRKLFLKAGGLDVDLQFSMDLDLWFRLLPQARRIVHIPQVLSCLRMHGSAKTQAGVSRSLAETCRVLRRYAADVPLTTAQRLRSANERVRLHACRIAASIGVLKASA